MADAHRHRDLPLGDLCEHHTAGARRVLLKHLPHEGHRNRAKLSPRLTGWTALFSEGTLAQGEGHDVILLKTCFRMQSAPALFEGKVHFYPQENQRVQLKNSKSCRKSVYAGAELKVLLGSIGFTTVQLYGRFEGAAYGPGANRLIAVAHKSGK